MRPENEWGESSFERNQTHVTHYEKELRMWAMILHLSALANSIAPGAGLIAPIVIWQIKKDEFPEIDAHGKMATNWVISLLIYLSISFALIFVFVGLFLLPVLGLMAIIFPIIAGIKANSGEYWNYPLTIRFFK